MSVLDRLWHVCMFGTAPLHVEQQGNPAMVSI